MKTFFDLCDHFFRGLGAPIINFISGVLLLGAVLTMLGSVVLASWGFITYEQMVWVFLNVFIPLGALSIMLFILYAIIDSL